VNATRMLDGTPIQPPQARVRWAVAHAYDGSPDLALLLAEGWEPIGIKPDTFRAMWYLRRIEGTAGR